MSLCPDLRSCKCTSAQVIVPLIISKRSSGPVKISDLYLQTSKLGIYLRIGYPISQI